MRNLFLFITAMSLHVNAATDPRLNYQMGLSQMGDKTKKPLKGIRSEGRDLLAAARGEADGISQQDYNFLKGTSAFAASGAEWAHLEGIKGQGVTILLLEDSGINHADTKKVVETGSPENSLTGMQYKLDHGSGMASLIHALAPDSTIRVRPIGQLSTSLDSKVRIVNASFGGKFKNSFIGINETSNVLIAKSAGNHQENLSEHTEMEGCEPLLPFTIFTGNLRQDYKDSTSSGFPGTKREFQNSFLWVIADDVLKASGADGSTEYSPGSGTSNAAAILSGAAALLLSKYPTLTTEELKEILLESADRDIFQLFGSGYRALHISDNSVDFYRKQTQYKKTHKDKSILDFAENLANSKDTILAAEIVGGSRGISNRGTTPAEVEQFKRILKKIKESGNEKLLSLAPDTARTEPERKHREIIQQMLTADTSSASATTQTKSHNYDPALWGKGVLNIKNALIYAELKMRYPAMSAHGLRERMLESINTKQQMAAERIQRKLRSRAKATEEQKEAWDERQGLTINTSLLGRTFTKMQTDPSEPGVADQSDEDRLKGLGFTLPEAPAGRKLKTISDGSGGADRNSGSGAPVVREIAPIPDADISESARVYPAFVDFLKSDKVHLVEKFNAFSEQVFTPLMSLEPRVIAERLRNLNLSVPQMKNRVLFKERSFSNYYCNFHNEKVTIITLFHDYLSLKIGTRELTEDKSKIIKIAMHLLTGYASDLEKQEILSLLKQYIEYGDTEVHNFIINNDLLNVHFRNVEIETYYKDNDYSQQPEKRILFKFYTGFDIIDEWGLSNIMDNSPSPQTKAMLKRFFKTQTGTSVLAKITIKKPIQRAINSQINWDNLKYDSPTIESDATGEGIRILTRIFADPQKELPEMFRILKDYSDNTVISELTNEMNLKDNEINVDYKTPQLKHYVVEYLKTTLPNVFK